jgi:hypothetical protein|tara:strand:+ start:497 stop:607 length:111 start_codon:yes stop_codon:yes gene_type:complete
VIVPTDDGYAVKLMKLQLKVVYKYPPMEIEAPHQWK